MNIWIDIDLVWINELSILSLILQDLKLEMPPACDSVTKAGDALLKATHQLKQQPFSSKVRYNLVDSARNILEGTMKVNLTLNFIFYLYYIERWGVQWAAMICSLDSESKWLVWTLIGSLHGGFWQTLLSYSASLSPPRSRTVNYKEKLAKCQWITLQWIIKPCGSIQVKDE